MEKVFFSVKGLEPQLCLTRLIAYVADSWGVVGTYGVVYKATDKVLVLAVMAAVISYYLDRQRVR